MGFENSGVLSYSYALARYEGDPPSPGPDPGGSGTTPGGGGPRVTPESNAERARARGLRPCLSRARRRHTRARRQGPRGRRRAARLRRAARRRCLARYGRTPGRVTGLKASALSETKIVLSFRAAGTDRKRPPAARSYVVKQSTRPIRGRRGFRRAQTLCNGSCRFSVTHVGAVISLTITDLRPRTTYYYAVAARDNVSRRLGPRSGTVQARTR